MFHLFFLPTLCLYGIYRWRHYSAIVDRIIALMQLYQLMSVLLFMWKIRLCPTNFKKFMTLGQLTNLAMSLSWMGLSGLIIGTLRAT